MQVLKRDQSLQNYHSDKIKNAIAKAFSNLNSMIEDEKLNEIVQAVETHLYDGIAVETIQDYVEETLMSFGYYKEAKAYILYRNERSKVRSIKKEIIQLTRDEALLPLLIKIEEDFKEEAYNLQHLLNKYRSFIKEGMSNKDRFLMLERAAVESISKEAPKWEFIAARFLTYRINKEIDERILHLNIHSFYEKIVYLTDQKLYGDYILMHYSQAEIEALEKELNESYNELFTYSGLDLLVKRYLIVNHDHEVLEKTQEMFMGIAMHLAMNEKDKLHWAKKFYEMLARLKVTMATPTMSNSRKPFHQMSSCFIDTVPDDLKGIYKSLDNFAQVSKYGGGMGLYFGKVRANGSDIRGYKKAAGGVIRWIKLVNDTAVAVDQLGVRAGAAAVYLDAWHRDLPEFLQLRTNNGDDRMKAHDIFPGVCYPDLFWKLAKEDLNAPWYLMCPHEILTVKGYALEDYYGEEWEIKYQECIADPRIEKRVFSVKEIVRLIIKSLVETGTPFTFNRDIVNRANPNHDKGIIYCSNLCTEIAQNMSSIEKIKEEVITVGEHKIVVDGYQAGDFVVCNLASLILGNMNVDDDAEMKDVIQSVVRALDNVIDLNFYPLPYAQITNAKYRPIGLGTSGYHHLLVQKGIKFESDEHLKFADELYEKINYYSIEASKDLAKEKGSYQNFKGSDWDTGLYFEKRNYNSDEWLKLQNEVHEYGLRNAYLLAIAPTSSTSIIAGTTAAVDPILNKFFMEEKKGMMIARVAPGLNPKTFWLYKNAHLIDQNWVIDAAGIRGRHIDQAQSVNLYITNEFTFKQILNLYIRAYEKGVKTLYYVRSKSLEVEECESCSA